MTADRWSSPHTTVVTGAAGWLGRALVDRLLRSPDRPALRLLAHDAAEERALRAVVDGHPDIEGRNVRFVVGDVSRPDTARRLLHGLDEVTDVIHTAGVIHPRRVRQFTEVNADGTRHVAEAARDLGVRRLVHVSSNSPFGTNPDHGDTFRADEPYRPYLGYGLSKMQAEEAVFENVAAGLDATIVRPPWFYGPFQPPRQTTFFRMVRTGRFPVIGQGQQRRSMVFVGNLVDGVLAAELTPGATGKGYWIADERPYTVAEIVETVGRALTDEGLTVAPPSTRLPVLAARVAERADRIVQGLGLYQQQLHVLGEMGHSIACDVSRSVDELGWTPRIALYEGMRTSIRWCLEQGLEL